MSIFAKAGSLQRLCSHEIMGLGREESSFDHIRRSHGSRCDRVSHNRAARANARGVLGLDRDFGRQASTLGATLTLSLERIVATAVGASATRLLHFGKERRLALTHNDTGKPIFATRAL
jgi:hypothetical protein